MKVLAWFSCGITSAVAIKLYKERYKESELSIYYIDISTAHKDNARFIKDCESWYGQKINIVKSNKFDNQFEVIKKRKFINSPQGAPCTKILKKDVRQEVESQIDYDFQIFGFEYSKKEINRAVRFKEQNPYTKPLYPLIDNKISKEQAADILLKNGIKLPKMYELGYHNNNCIGCVKGGAGYWNKIRLDFPNEFKKMSDIEEELGHSCIKNKPLKTLKEDEGRHSEPILPDCSTFCEIEFEDIIDKRAIEVYTGLKEFKQLKF
jgi:3'-phosphoadenosine 5'-phosphosulfate sulfotransferase (PAPS reductase)/FAD synthetase